jgi:FkbM family methyltransferase
MVETFISTICNAYRDLAVCHDRELLLADLGSAGLPDLYIAPLHQFRGKCLRIEGRKDATTPLSEFYSNHGVVIQMGIIPVDCWVSKVTGHSRVYIRDSGSSNFLDLDTDFSIMTTEEQSVSTKVVNTVGIAELLEASNFEYLSYCKLDIEGSERDILEGIFQHFTGSNRPSVLEVEINVGRYDRQTDFGQFITYLDQSGYRLIDIRKSATQVPCNTYGQMLQNQLHGVSEATSRGVLFQFDGLFVKKRNLFDPTIDQLDLMDTVSILCCYRQFSLACKIVELNESTPRSLKNIISGKIEKILGIVDKEARANPYTILGLHPYFNFNKYR